MYVYIDDLQILVPTRGEAKDKKFFEDVKALAEGIMKPVKLNESKSRMMYNRISNYGITWNAEEGWDTISHRTYVDNHTKYSAEDIECVVAFKELVLSKIISEGGSNPKPPMKGWSKLIPNVLQRFQVESREIIAAFKHGKPLPLRRPTKFLPLNKGKKAVVWNFGRLSKFKYGLNKIARFGDRAMGCLLNFRMVNTYKDTVWKYVPLAKGDLNVLVQASKDKKKFPLY